MREVELEWAFKCLEVLVRNGLRHYFLFVLFFINLDTIEIGIRRGRMSDEVQFFFSADWEHVASMMYISMKTALSLVCT
jgi:hypothetical protein